MSKTITAKEYQAMHTKRKRGAKAPLTAPMYKSIRMRSGLEVRYAAHLDAMVWRGEIERWDYEPEKFLIGKSCSYTPDFRVTIGDRVFFIETKGYKREAGRIKFRTTAKLNPMYGFIMVGESNGRFVLRENLTTLDNTLLAKFTTREGK